jgi:hypothetical protein
LWEENHTNTWLGAVFRPEAIKKLPWNLRHNTGTISRDLVTSTGTSMFHAAERRETLLDDLVRTKFLCEKKFTRRLADLREIFQNYNQRNHA